MFYHNIAVKYCFIQMYWMKKIWFVINYNPRGKYIVHLIDEDNNEI